MPELSTTFSNFYIRKCKNLKPPADRNIKEVIAEMMWPVVKNNKEDFWKFLDKKVRNNIVKNKISEFDTVYASKTKLCGKNGKSIGFFNPDYSNYDKIFGKLETLVKTDDTFDKDECDEYLSKRVKDPIDFWVYVRETYPDTALDQVYSDYVNDNDTETVPETEYPECPEEEETKTCITLNYVNLTTVDFYDLSLMKKFVGECLSYDDIINEAEIAITNSIDFAPDSATAIVSQWAPDRSSPVPWGCSFDPERCGVMLSQLELVCSMFKNEKEREEKRRCMITLLMNYVNRFHVFVTTGVLTAPPGFVYLT